MAADAFDKRRQAEGWLSALNCLVAGANLFTLPCCAFGWWFSWSMTDASDKWLKDAEIFFILIPSGGMLFLSGALCLGFLAGVALSKGDPWGRTLTSVLVIVAALHLFLGMVAITTLAVRSSPPADPSRWLYITLYPSPSLLYCIAAPLLLRVQNRPGPVDVETEAQAPWQPPHPLASQEGIIEGKQRLGTRADRPVKKEPQLPQEREDDRN